MDRTNIGGFASVSLDYENKSENPLPLRPFAAWKTEGGVALYLNEQTLRVNGEKIKPRINGQSSSDNGAYLHAGDWWCFIFKRKPYSEADPYDMYDAVVAQKSWATGENEIVYCFRVIEVFEDLSFQQYAYGGVDITGLPIDTSRMAPFHISVEGYRDDCKSERTYKLYAPKEPEGVCAKYNGEPCEVRFYDDDSNGDPEEQGDFYEIKVDEKGKATVYGVITSPNPDAKYPKYYLEITQQETNVVYERVESFCIAEIGPDGNGIPKEKEDDESDGDSSEDQSSSDDSEETPLSVSWAMSMSLKSGNGDGEKSGDSGDVRYRTLLRPFGITSFKSESKPDWSGKVMMYLPKNSLFLNSEIIEVQKTEETKGDLMLLSEGDWWCVITGDPNDDDATASASGTFQAYSDTDIHAKKMYAKVVKSAGYPTEKGLFFAFKVATVIDETFAEGNFQEFAYGQVQLGMNMPGVHHMVPFEVMTVDWVTNDAILKREYYCYTPDGQSLFYKGKSVQIEGTEGSWTKLPVKNEDQYFGVTIWCYRLSRQQDEDLPVEISSAAKLTTDRKEFAVGLLDFYFPVCRIGPGYEDDSGMARALIVGVETTESGRKLNGARVDVEKMAGLFSGYVNDGIVLVDDEASVDGVKEAMQWAVKSSEAAVIYFSCHGGCDNQGNNVLALYDGHLTDADVWEAVSSAKCPVLLIFDACQSGTMWGPPSVDVHQSLGAASRKDWATAMKARALGSGAAGANVRMLCWAAAADDKSAWSNPEYGGYLTTAIAQYATKGLSYWAIFSKVYLSLTHQEPPFVQVPVSTEIGNFWNTQPFFLAEPQT